MFKDSFRTTLSNPNQPFYYQHHLLVSLTLPRAFFPFWVTDQNWHHTSLMKLLGLSSKQQSFNRRLCKTALRVKGRGRNSNSSSCWTPGFPRFLLLVAVVVRLKAGRIFFWDSTCFEKCSVLITYYLAWVTLF